MKNIIFLTLTICFSFIKAQAQHCAYYFASIIVVSIHEKDIINNITNLKVTLVDSSGNAVLDSYNNEIVFWQNPKKTISEYNSPKNAKEIRYPFAKDNKDNYVWVCDVNFSVNDYYLKIEKTEAISKYKLPHYEVIKLYEIDKFRLCDTYKNEDYYTYSGRRLYKPIEIIVQRN